ncbi:heat-inducible transcriptional repressor HrcA [Yonghaparkia sp. Root332]|uniref:heat-inducible transcriptional repressor HrcA n=1 Tax=Yonghaparkia sp. Root332 TaxID=1736516 RepID=UPI0006F56241|nr:heat-inducible transcriptional repressor HrcA [Yonghaparkia sp. Root332]KQV24871.1 HrcA family transcriptional regulator [Yonghaparkia sp. Root332]
MISERALHVLRAIVQDYVASREPVGSKAIVERHHFGVSAATIRNDMAQLEEEELIAAPHTSSGRVPTDKGYRLFVDELQDLRPLSAAQRQAIAAFLDQSVDLDDVFARTVRLLASLTNQVALVQYPTLGHARVRHVELVPLSATRVMTVFITDGGRVDQRIIELPAETDEVFLGELRAKINAAIAGRSLSDVTDLAPKLDEQFAPDRRAAVSVVTEALLGHVDAHRSDRLVMAGAANLVRTESDFAGSVYPVLEAIEEQVTLLKLFREMELDQHGVSARIGRENDEVLRETAVVTSAYRVGADLSAKLGVLGPTRMDYSNNMAAVRAVARYVSRLLGEE